ncbi:FAD/NAD(P)-binding domain-containing protein [Xylariaceae sp. FL0662B]|nr:FAD/NAD(P)-binding domain-containing protein [Xylariaceae sp. FL0662B]
MTPEYDIIIISADTAGLSTASSIVRQDHKTLLFDSGQVPERTNQTHAHEAEVETLKQRENGYLEVTTSGKTWRGKKVILATGVEDIFPSIPGYDQCWVSGIFHCLCCHGWEEKGHPSAGVLAEGDANAALTLHLGRQALRLPEQRQMAVEPRKILRLVKVPDRSEVQLHFGDGARSTEAFVAHKPKFALHGDLHQQLGLQLSSTGMIVVSPPSNQTRVRAFFAAGDCASPMNTITQALHSGTCTGGGAPLQVQAETWNEMSLV